MRNLTAQVCDVNKPLLSVKKVLKAGHRVVFDEDGSYIEDKVTGETMSLREESGMYVLKLWVRRGGNPGFPGGAEDGHGRLDYREARKTVCTNN